MRTTEKKPTDEYLTASEVSAWLKVPDGTIRLRTRTGQQPFAGAAVRLGPRSIRYHRPTIEAWLAAEVATGAG